MNSVNTNSTFFKKGALKILAFLVITFYHTTTEAQISGFVFRDFNGNGTRQTTQGAPLTTSTSSYTAGFVEPIVSGIIVTAYDSDDQIVASYTTTGQSLSTATPSSTANYTIPASGSVYNGTKGSNTGSVANNAAVRLEFTIPVNVICLINGTYDFSSGGGKTYGTSVRFLAGSGSARTAVNFALNNPHDYVAGSTPETSTYIFQAVQFNGNPAGSGTTASENALVKFPYGHNGTKAATPLLASEILASAAQIGSVYGVAYSKYARKVFTSAFMKRHAGFGPANGTFNNAPGAIYIVDPTLSSTTATKAASYFVSLDALGYPTHNTASGAPAYGSATSYDVTTSQPSNEDSRTETVTYRTNGFGVIGANSGSGSRGLPADKASPSNDVAAFGHVGKVSLGAIEMSEDGKYLFVVNLYDRKIYQLQLNSITNPTAATYVTSWLLPDPPARSGSGLTGASTVYSNSLSKINDFYNGTKGLQRPFALKYHRGKLYIGSVTTGENGGETTTDNNSGNAEYTDLWAYVWELTPSSGFTSTPVLQFPLNYNKGTNVDDYNETWKAWTNAMPPSNVYESGNSWSSSQAMLTGIEFDVDGSMILAIRDLSGDKGGFANYMLTGTAVSRTAVAFGDQLRAYKNSSTCTFELESAGKEGPNSSKSASSGATNGQGPGGGEFYYTDGIERYNGSNSNANYHLNTAMGGLALLPGMEEVTATFMDPLALWSGGLSWSRSFNGLNTRDFELYVGTAVGDIGKANGLGDVELLFENPPIEIGNRVWRDNDRDGIQDAGEAGIAGVILELVTSDGSAVDSDSGTDGVQPTYVTTDSDGNWFITSGSGTDATGINYGVGLLPETSYKLRLATTGAGADWSTSNNGGPVAGGDLVGLTLTKANIVGHGEADLSDSDASLVSGVPEISFTTGVYGQNNHTLDIGFAEHVNLGNQVWKDLNNNGLIDSGEPKFSGVTVNLYKDDNDDGTPDGAAIASTTTDTDGLYLFGNLLPGNYIVGVVTPAGYYSSSVNAGDPDTDADDGDDNGVTVSGTETLSNTVTLTAGGEPTTENPDSNPANGTSNNSSNLTVDFGFVQLMNLGNKVWRDSNNDGLIGNGETAISGVTVKLYRDADGNGVADGSALDTKTTDASGLYLFTGLYPGKYLVSVVGPSGLLSSTVDANNPDDDVDKDDNGVTTTSGETFSKTVTLINGAEPENDGNPDNNPEGTANNNSNLSVDFGFYDPSVLPVKLVNFEGKADDQNRIDLSWSTTEESNSSHFEVQRSSDGFNWSNLGIVLALGESSVGRGYTFRDTDARRGNNLYRLRMIDRDATFAYSRIINVQIDGVQTLNLFPNPASDHLKIESTGPKIQTVQIYSLIGKLVHQVKSPVSGEISVAGLPAGIYQVKVTSVDGLIEMRKVIIHR